MTDIPEDITRQVAALLNEALKQDPVATAELLRFGATCSQRLENHPDIIVREIPGDPPQYQLSALGLINSILLKIGQKRVAMVEEDSTNQILSFKPFRTAE